MFNSNGLSPSDVALLDRNNNDGFFGNNGWWVLIIFALIFNNGWGGGLFGGGNSGSVRDAYVLGSDVSMISRQLSDGFNSIDNALDAQNTGICNLGYTALEHANQTNMNIMQSANALQSQLAQCCCDNREAIAGVNYNMATQANGITNAINTGFCQTNYNAQTNTRDIVESQNAGTRAILDKLSQMETNAKDEKIAELQTINSDLRFQASQVAQNNFIQNLVKPPIQPCYVTQNPYCSCGNANAFGYGYYGTTIA